MSQRSPEVVEGIINSYNDKKELIAWANYHNYRQHSSVISRLVEIESGMDYSLSNEEWRQILSCMNSVEELDAYVGDAHDSLIEERRNQLQSSDRLFSNKKVFMFKHASFYQKIDLHGHQFSYIF